MAKDENQKPLTEMHKRFCEEYLKCPKLSICYRAAGYQAKDDKSASASASRLLKDPRIQEYIALLRGERSQRVHVSSDQVIIELGRIAFAQMANFATWSDKAVSIRDSADLPPELTAAIAEIRFEERVAEDGATITNTHIKLHPKLPALAALAKHTGVLMDLNQALRVMERYSLEVIDPYGELENAKGRSQPGGKAVDDDDDLDDDYGDLAADEE